jgi:diguanylate cyclase (GGDEF)-like protein
VGHANFASAAVVVLADDDTHRRRAMADRLSGVGHQVVVASTAASAIEYCRSVEPDLLVINVDLDAGLGLAALDRLRVEKLLGDIPIITTSNDPSTRRVVDCLQRGAQDHLRAPFDAGELVARVEVALRLADERVRLQQRKAELEYLGGTDELTGLRTRRQIEEELARLGSAAARHHQPLAAVLVAVDDWPSIRAFGTLTSDGVLQEIAVLIAAIARTADVAGRFSESEFLVVLPMTNGQGARTFAERVRAVVAAAPILTEDGPLVVTVAAGCADGAPGPHELLDRARTALGRAVVAGGNTLVSISA